MRALAPFVLVLLAGCSIGRAPDPGRVHHVVLCWLKESGNPEHRRQVVGACRAFRSIPGVIDVRAGEVLGSERKIVDDSFDVALVISFANADDMRSYLTHPLHQETKQEILLPLMERIVAYDFRE